MYRPILLLACVIALVGCSRERQVTVIKLAHGLDSEHPVHKAMVYLGERLAEKSAGTMRVDVYSGGQLGSERESIELLQLGGLGMTKTSASVLEGFAPQFKVFGLPYLFRDEAHKLAVLDGPIGNEILAAPTAKFLRGLCYYEAGNRSFYAKKPIRTPDDLAGLKIRVQESPMAFALIRAFGGAATPIAWGELYTSLQQGVVDGAENNPPSFHLSRHYEVCKYYTINEHTAVPDVLLVSEHLWQRLDARQQQWLKESADESAIHQRKLWEVATRTALEEVQKAGVEIIYPDKALFAQRVVSVHENVASDPVVGVLDRRIAEVRP